VESPTFKRLSSKKAAHATMGGAAYRNPGISPVFGEMWDSAALRLTAFAIPDSSTSQINIRVSHI
jgi:hypothetical protein